MNLVYKTIFFLLFSFSIFSQNAPVTGEASYYADKFFGKPTASGEIYDPKKYTAASRDFPFNAIVKVTNLGNNKFVYVRVNDKLPKKTRVIDLSRIAAEKIDMIQSGTAQVRVEFVQMGEAGKDPNQNIEKKEPAKKETAANFDLEDDEDEDEDEEEEEHPLVLPQGKEKTSKEQPVTKQDQKPPTKKTQEKLMSKYVNFEGKPQFPKGVGLQIASFKNESFAVKAATRLHLQGYSNVVIEKYDANPPVLYRLIVWGFQTEEEALQFGKKLEKIGYEVYFIYQFSKE